MVSRPARVRWSRAVEAQRRQVQRLDEGVDHLNRVVLIHPVLKAFGEKGTLRTVGSFDETTHPILPHLNGKNLPDSRVSTQPGSEVPVQPAQRHVRSCDDFAKVAILSRVPPRGCDSGSPRGARIMRYELSDYEWSVIRPMLPNKPRGVPRVTTGAFSTASSGSCDQVRRGAICRRRTTIASVRSCLVHCNRGRRCWPTADMTPTGSENSPSRKEHGQTFLRSGTVVDLLQHLPLPKAELGRAVLQQDQAVPTNRHPLRQARRQLSCLRQARVHPPVTPRL